MYLDKLMTASLMTMMVPSMITWLLWISQAIAYQSHRQDYEFNGEQSPANRKLQVAGSCGSYFATDTNSASINSPTCNLYLCPGETLIASMCGNEGGICSGDTVLLLLDNYGTSYTYNDDSYCGACSYLVYTSYITVCQNYILNMGCFSTSYCDGTVMYQILPPNPTFQPVFQPLQAPTTETPSFIPTVHPTIAPTMQPTAPPTSVPSMAPTAVPTNPTNQPSCSPTSVPSQQPSSAPSTQPTVMPTVIPSNIPTLSPSASPTTQPSTTPSSQPIISPSSYPTMQPSSQPIWQPRANPSSQPSVTPSIQPTSIPSTVPTCRPTSQPSATPSCSPSTQPTSHPSTQPRASPTSQPSAAPSFQPSGQPVGHPTSQPSACPSMQPTLVPSAVPTYSPTSQPSSIPSCQPSYFPTAQPTLQPSSTPSCRPTIYPSSQPSLQPTSSPSTVPTSLPSMQPTCCPSSKPSISPSFQPSASPTRQPSSHPTQQPTCQPTAVPSQQPSRFPSYVPSMQPTTNPSAQPSTQPTMQPTLQPALFPTSQPFSHPSAQPSCSPTSQPSSYPTVEPTLSPSSNPTSSPTASPLDYVPVIVYSREDLQIQSARMQVTVRFDRLPAYPGSVFCASPVATSNYTSSTPLRSLVFSSTYQGSYVTGSVFVTIVIQPLQAVTSYTLYCGVRTSTGYSSSNEQLQASRLLYLTECCKSVSFEKSSASIYSDPDIYISGSVSGNIIKFSLSAPPSEGLQVTPYLAKSTNGQLSQEEVVQTSCYQLSPTSLQYAKDSLSLAGSISLLATNLTVGTYQLRLILSGVSSWEYIRSNNMTVQVIFASTAPPPKLSVVRMTNDGTGLFVFFDSNTNFADVLNPTSTSWPCSYLFDFVVSASSSCRWLNRTAIIVLFPAWSSSTSAALSLVHIDSSIIRVVDGKVKAECVTAALLAKSCPNATSSSDRMAIVGPLTPIVPSVVLKTEQQVNVCSNATLDPTGSGGQSGRPWLKVSWEVSAPTGFAVDGIRNVLAGYSSDTSRRITIPNKLLQATTYFVTLKLTNFLGQSASASIFFTFGADPNTPAVLINGPTTLSWKSFSQLQLSASAALSPCSSGSTSPLSPSTMPTTAPTQTVSISYFWAIYFENTLLSLSSISRNPLNLKLPSYVFQSGKTYIVQFNAVVEITTSGANNGSYDGTTTNMSARRITQDGLGRDRRLQSKSTVTASTSITIQVPSGAVQASIKGGSTRLISNNITLDASSSYDENDPDASKLRFSWQCWLASAVDFGFSCDNVLVSIARNRSTLLVPYPRLQVGVNYMFEVSVLAPDNRAGTSTVTVKKLQLSRMFASINLRTKSLSVNQDQQVVINADIESNVAISGVWSASIDATTLPLSNTLTPFRRNFTLQDMSFGKISYPLMIPGNVFAGGLSVNFRLTVLNQGSLLSYSEVALSINGPPLGGVVLASPQNGTALTTIFMFQTSGWIADLDDLPLSYDFRYEVVPQSTTYFIQTRSNANSVSSSMPPGLQSNKYAVFITATAYDVMLSAGSVKTTSYIDPAMNIDYAEYATKTLSALTALQNTDQTLAAINAISSSMNAINCSLASADYCGSLNRQPCSTVPNLCASCLSGFVGVVGASNNPCFPESQPGKAKGEQCLASSECLYNLCVEGVCAAPVQQCPSSKPTSPCSGHGRCVYKVNGKDVAAKDCTIVDTACAPSCACILGYGGEDCSLDQTELMQRQSARVLMCEILGSTLNASNPSNSILDSMSSSMLTTYNPFEVVSSEGVSACASSFDSIVQLAKDGYLSLETTKTVQNLLDTISKFVVVGNSSSLNQTVSMLVEGSLKSMIYGQDSIALVSNNLRLLLARNLASRLSNSTNQTPLTESERSYGMSSPKIQFLEGSASFCDDGNGYSSLSFGSWNTNPFANATSFETSIFRTQSFQAGESNLSRRGRRRTTWVDGTEETRQPAYYLSFPFAQQQSLLDSSMLDSVSNYTIPACTQYAGEQLALCGSCELSYYTNSSVVFVCFDIEQVCPGGSGAAAYSNSRGEGGEEAGLGQRRDLQISTDDDEADLFASSPQNIVYQTGSLLVAIKNELKSVLSTNPFLVDIETAAPILAFVSSLALFFVAGSIYYYRWDRADRNYIIYLKLDPDRKKKLEDIQKEDTLRLKVEEVEARFNNYKNRTSEEFWMASPISKLFGSQKGIVSKLIKKNPFVRILDEAIPLVNMDNYNWYRHYIEPIFRYHDFFNVNGQKSLSDTRLLRFVNLFLQLLFALFIDTLFFSVFYADTGQCESFLTEADCVQMVNSATNQALCTWTPAVPDNLSPASKLDSAGSCGLTPPPEDIIFTIILSCVTMILTVPISFFYDYVRFEICAKRPNLATVGWDPLKWLGLATYEIQQSMDAPKATRRKRNVNKGGKKFGSNNKLFIQSENYYNRDRETDSDDDVDEDKDKEDAEDSHGDESVEDVEQTKPTTSLKRSQSIHLRQRRSSVQVVKSRNNDNNWHNSSRYYEAEMMFLSRCVFTDIASMGEEAQHILEEVRRFFGNPNHRIPPPKGVVHDLTRSQARCLAIKKSLGLDEFGQWRKLTLRKRLMYGPPHERMVQKLTKSRQGAEDIAGMLVVEEEGMAISVDNDVALIQHFVLEQLPPFQRFALKYQTFVFPYLSPDKVHPVLWLAGWLFLYGSVLFFLYWILAWCLSSGGKAFRAWGINYILAFVQDVFFVQMGKVYFLYIGTITIILPNLKAMHHSLSELAMKLQLQDANSEAQAELVNRLQEFRVVQYLSPTCRAARKRQFSKLLAARLLHYVDDRDLYHCRYVERRMSTTALHVLLFSMPVVLMYVGEFYAQTSFELLFPTVTSLVVVVFAFLLQFSTLFFGIVLAGLVVFLVGKSTVRSAATQSKELVEKSLSSKMTDEHHDRKFYQAQRQRSTVTIISYVRFLLHRCQKLVIDLIATGYKLVDGRAISGRKVNSTWRRMNVPQAGQDLSLVHKQAGLTPKLRSPGSMIMQGVAAGTGSLTRSASFHSKPTKTLSCCEILSIQAMIFYDRSGYEQEKQLLHLVIPEEIQSMLYQGQKVGVVAEGIPTDDTGLGYVERLVSRHYGLTASPGKINRFVFHLAMQPTTKKQLREVSKMLSIYGGTLQLPNKLLLEHNLAYKFKKEHYVTSNPIDAVIRAFMQDLGMEFENIVELLEGIRQYLYCQDEVYLIAAASNSKLSLDVAGKVKVVIKESAARKKIWQDLQGISMLQRELEDILRTIFLLYLPCGEECSEEEFKEVVEDFRDWANAHTVMEGYKEAVITLNHFLLWFEEVYKRIERCKLAVNSSFKTATLDPVTQTNNNFYSKDVPDSDDDDDDD